MKRVFGVAVVLLGLGAAMLPIAGAQAVTTCTATNFYRDGINLTAAIIDPTYTVTGTVDATGCNIGVYYSPSHTGTITNADIFGASYYGVFVNGSSVDISDSRVHDIGDDPAFTGAQHGTAIYYTTVASGTADDGFGNYTQPACTSGTTTGTISNNTVFDYQKAGIVANCTGVNVSITNNTVTGEGQIAYIAQNGIQVAFGAKALVRANTVSDNWYTPEGTEACGLLLFQASGVKLQKWKNTLFNNEVNFCNFGRGGGHVSPA